ncbi:unnamed protein product, partial [Musa banksii]
MASLHAHEVGPNQRVFHHDAACVLVSIACTCRGPVDTCDAPDPVRLLAHLLPPPLLPALRWCLGLSVNQCMDANQWPE